jgi:hypothetical protein
MRVLWQPQDRTAMLQQRQQHDGGMLSLFLITLLLACSLHVDPFRSYSTMGITTRSTVSKEKPTRTTITPKQAQRSTHPPKLPRSDNFNSLLAEINRPTSRFDNALQASRPPTGRGSNKYDTLDDPCNLDPPTDKNNQMTQVTSPTGVDTLTLKATSPADNNDPANNEFQDQKTPSSKGV